MTIPVWNSAGVIPPIRPDQDGAGPDRSPYHVTSDLFIKSMCLTDDRAKILRGLLNYRKGLYGLGLTTGYQWLDGSFCEEIEVFEKRAPRDIDAVTFLDLPASFDRKQIAKYPDLFDKAEAKRVHFVDANFVQLGQPLTENSVRTVAYWYSLWSHRRDGLWKGFAQVPLSHDNDAVALEIIDDFEKGRGQS